MKNKLLVVGVASLGVVAASGWLRGPQPVVAQQPAAVPAIYGSVASEQARPYLTPVAHRFADDNGDDGYRPRRKVSRASTRYRAAENTVNDNYRYRSEPEYKTRRSTKKSVAIVAGSSAAGAAIGALAGGGKGAAIGAISAGVGGLIYDRVTR